MVGLLPLMFALAIAETGVGVRGVATAALVQWLALAALALGWFAVAEMAVRRWLPSWPMRRLAWWDGFGHAVSLVGAAWLTYGLGWAQDQRAFTLALLPWLLLTGIHWWTLTGLYGGSLRRRWTRMSHQARFSVLPILLILPFLDACTWVARHTPIEAFLMGHLGVVANGIGSLLVAVGMVALMPWALIRLWRAQPLPNGPESAALTAACATGGVRGARLMVLPGGGEDYNAAILGVVPGLKYVVFTGPLLRDFSADERLAVLGHELGHSRYRHLWLYVVFVVGAGLSAWVVEPWLRALVALVPGSAHLDPALVRGLILIVTWLVLMRGCFGVLSRACERQADLHGADLAGPTAMIQALKRVAQASGQAEDAPSWRHRSIAARCAFLFRHAAEPGLAAHHHRLVAHMRLFLLGSVLLLALVALHRLGWLGA